MTQFNSNVYLEQGGDKQVIASGGEQEVQSGGMVTVQSGGSVDLESGADVDVQSGASITVASGGVLTVESGASVDVQAGGLVGTICGATFVIGAEGSDIINVGIQLTDSQGAALAVAGHVRAYLSDSSAGVGIAATAPATSVAIGTDGAIIVADVAKLAWQLQSETDGDIDLDITETGTDTWYLVVVLPDGRQVVSSAITFAA